jgi:cytochrome c553
MAALKQQGGGFGLASCDACHTRHTFSVQEARQPQACRTCHTGFDHAQWEMYQGSKHGTRHELKQLGILGENAAAPTCQSCHLPKGNHEVRTAWGFLGLRLPMPEDAVWAQARTSLFRALGLINAKGEPTARLSKVAELDFIRQSESAWQKERETMISVCSQCHSENFARGELRKGDEMIREADLVMAEAISLVADLYDRGVLDKPQGYQEAFPDVLAFHDAPSTIEQKLFLMFQEYRMRSFQGVFHANPDYALWYGWSKMQQTLTEMKDLARHLSEKRQ